MLENELLAQKISRLKNIWFVTIVKQISYNTGELTRSKDQLNVFVDDVGSVKQYRERVSRIMETIGGSVNLSKDMSWGGGIQLRGKLSESCHLMIDMDTNVRNRLRVLNEVFDCDIVKKKTHHKEYDSFSYICNDKK